MSTEIATLRHELLAINGSTVSRGAQAFTFDERNRQMYVLEAGAITLYPMDSGVGVNPISASLIDGTAIGHQGLSIEPFTTPIKLWTTSYSLGRAACRFSYTPNVAINVGDVYELFPTGTFANSTSCTPTVSQDGRFLIAHGTRFGTQIGVVRVFDLAAMVQRGAGNHTDKFLYEWETQSLADASNPMQGLACDGTYVYMNAGGTGFTADVNKRLHVYTIKGELVYKDNNLQVGRAAALLDPNGTRFEPEGLAMLMATGGKPALTMGILSGDPGKRRFRIYQFNDEFRGYLGNRRNTFLARIRDFADAVHSRMVVPINQKNNLLVTGPDGKFAGRAVFHQSSIVENDTELNNQKGVIESFANVFKWWKRISRGGGTYTDTYLPAELDAWSYDAPTDSIKTTINSGSVMGFVSPEKYDDFVFEAAVSSTNNDDDFIGLIIAYALDPVTGFTHTLSVMRGANARAPMTIDKDYNGYGISRYAVANVLNGLTWPNGVVATGPGTNGANGGWATAPLGCRIKITREQDIITVETSQFNSDVYFEPAKTIIDLSADPELAVFRGPQSFGYTAVSQPFATWKVFNRPDTRIPIVDVRDWSKWTYVNNVWVKTASTKAALIAEGLLAKDWTHQNQTTGKFYYLDSASTLFRL